LQSGRADSGGRSLVSFGNIYDVSVPLLENLMNYKRSNGAPSGEYGFAIWGLVCLVISIVGFWPSYVAPLAAGTYRSPSPMMQWHVLSTALWLVLMVSQPWLAQIDRVDLHRWFGLFGVLVATGVVITGIVVQIDVMGPYAVKGDSTNAVLIPFIRLSLLLGYAVCVAWAIALRKRPDWHKRLILLGTFPLLQSAFDRMTANVLGLPEIRGLMAGVGHLMLMILFVIWDRQRHGYFHPVTKWGTILMILFYLGSPIIAGSEWWRGFSADLAKR
jgi:hypothetical protein